MMKIRIILKKMSYENSFQPRLNFNERSLSDWGNLTEDEFKRLLKKRAIKRTKFSGLKRNIMTNLKIHN